MTSTLRFTALLEPAEKGGFVVKCLELPVASQGETRDEALANIRDAIEGYLEVKAEIVGRQGKGEKVEVIVEAPSTLMASSSQSLGKSWIRHDPHYFLYTTFLCSNLRR